MVDRFKTQVMFLHPEPALMEPCASRLGEEFSVHMAASGTEALTTLGITPIDIIVSAQDLPGMTGQEALKEAKKRSPDTRSILVASRHMTEDDRAALVNVRHLNQVLRAESSPDEICAAIHATLRGETVSALAVPANDSSPGLNARELASSTTNAASTGSFPALSDIPVIEPSADAEVSAHAISHVEIVVLTNDASFLKTIRAAAGTSHVVNHAPNLQEAIDIAREGAAGVLITDAA
ncbi:MAG: response regulator, partial [Pseudomonadota bacterium]